MLPPPLYPGMFCRFSVQLISSWVHPHEGFVFVSHPVLVWCMLYGSLPGVTLGHHAFSVIHFTVPISLPVVLCWLSCGKISLSSLASWSQLSSLDSSCTHWTTFWIIWLGWFEVLFVIIFACLNILSWRSAFSERSGIVLYWMKHVMWESESIGQTFYVLSLILVLQTNLCRAYHEWRWCVDEVCWLVYVCLR